MFQVFRNDRDKRDFVSGGAAAGVAAAFGSPTGGIMFALEEASSFWSLSLTWKSYLCTMLSTSTLWMLLAARDDSQSYRGLVTFGAPDDRVAFQIWEMPFFLLIGIVGGLIGALFCELNFKLSHWRRGVMLGRPLRRVAEVLVCVFLTATCFYWIPIMFPRCLDKVSNYRCDDHQNKYNAPDGNYNCTDYTFYGTTRGACEEGEYSATGSIMFAGSEKIIKAMFHDHSQVRDLSFEKKGGERCYSSYSSENTFTLKYAIVHTVGPPTRAPILTL